MAISGHIKPAHNFVPEYQQSGIPHVETFVYLKGDDIINHIGEYKVEGDEDYDRDDAITAVNTFKYTFSTVTRWISLHAHYKNNGSGAFRVYFSLESALEKNDRYYLIDNESSVARLELKCKEIYVIPEEDEDSVVSVIAGLTNIRSEDFPDQTTENGFEGI